jgi:LuxR family maltose regulon positive regulatory protein
VGPTELVRDRLIDRLEAARHGALVVGPTGFGKSIAIGHWLDAARRPASIVTIEPYDDEPRALFQRLTDALAALIPNWSGAGEVGVELSLGSPLSSVVHLLRGAIGQVDDDADGVLVVDRIEGLTDPATGHHLASVLDAALDGMRIVLVGRSEVSTIPLATWISEGRLDVIDAEVLRFTDDEAARIAVAAGRPRADGVTANERYGGWPLPVRLCLVTGATPPVGTTAAVLDGLFESVVEGLPDAVVAGATALSVLDRFDAELVDELLADEVTVPASTSVIGDLRRNHLVERVDGSAHLAFPAPIRALLDRRLDWLGQERRRDLHLRAAKVYDRRGEIGAAHRHLLAAGEEREARWLLMEPVLRAVDSGDLVALDRLRRTHPQIGEVHDAGLAFDLAFVAFFAGDRTTAHRWLAEGVALTDDSCLPYAELQRWSTAGLLAKMDGRLDETCRCAEQFADLREVDPNGPIDRGFAIVGSLAELAMGDLRRARGHLAAAHRIVAERAFNEVIVPGLDVWLAVAEGRIDEALDLGRRVVAVADELRLCTNGSGFDARLVCALAAFHAGDPTASSALLDGIAEQTERLGFDWYRIRFSALSARLRIQRGGAVAAVDGLREARTWLDDATTVMAADLDAIEVRALLAAGRPDEARGVVDAIRRVDDERLELPSVRLAQVLVDPAAPIGDVGAWQSVPELVEARLVRASLDARPEQAVRRLVEDAAIGGLVSPFVERRAIVERSVPREVLERVHPKLAAVLRSSAERRRVPRADDWVPEPLTARERSVLALLPTHLSNGEIGEQLYVSVNTVKSNLKAIYRKLHVTGRSEAVEAARRQGLL